MPLEMNWALSEVVGHMEMYLKCDRDKSSYKIFILGKK